jgi:hypothetical protein
MTDIKDYIDNYTLFFSIKFSADYECYFLLFDSSSKWSKKFCEYLSNLKEIRISRSRESKNPFYFTCESFNEELKLEKVIFEDRKMIENICKTHFNEKAFLIKDEKDNYYINFNLENILRNSNYQILGIFLNPLDDFIKFLEDNQSCIGIDTVDKFTDVLGKNLL